MITFGTMQTSVKRITSNFSASAATEAKEWINQAQVEIARRTLPNNLVREDTLYTLSPLSDSSITLSHTDDASKFTLDAAVSGLTREYDGGKVDHNNQTFKIKYVNATTSAFTWDTNKLGTLSSTDWKIYQDEYTMPYYVDKLLFVWKTADNEAQLIHADPEYLNLLEPNQTDFDEPFIIGSRVANSHPIEGSKIDSTYLISCTSGNTYFSATAATPNSNHVGETIKVEGIPEMYEITATAGQTYDVDRAIQYAVTDNEFQVRPEGLNTIKFATKPDDVYRIYYVYLKTPERMIKDADLPDLPSQYHDLVLDLAIIKAKKYHGKSYLQDKRDFESKLDNLRSEYFDQNYIPRKAPFTIRGDINASLKLNGRYPRITLE